ncbi:hypothetical protein BGZ80_006002, partial [Entomortierella chlamydospora]
MFATGSRDKTIKIWAVPGCKNVATIKLPEAVTAVEFAPQVPGHDGEHVLAAGLEDGRIFLFKCLLDKPEEWVPLGEIKR